MSQEPQSYSEWYRTHLRPEYQKEYDEQQRKKQEKNEEESPRYTVSSISREGKVERKTGLSQEEARKLSREQLSKGYRSTSYEREGAIPESKAQKFAEESAQSMQERKHKRMKSIAHLFFGGKKHQSQTITPSQHKRTHVTSQGKKAASTLLRFFDEATKPRKGSGRRKLTRHGRMRKVRRHRRRRKRYGPRRLWR